MLSLSDEVGEATEVTNGPSVFSELLIQLSREAVSAFVRHCAESGADEEQLMAITGWANEFIEAAFPEGD